MTIISLLSSTFISFKENTHSLSWKSFKFLSIRFMQNITLSSYYLQNKLTMQSSCLIISLNANYMSWKDKPIFFLTILFSLVCVRRILILCNRDDKWWTYGTLSWQITKNCPTFYFFLNSCTRGTNSHINSTKWTCYGNKIIFFVNRLHT